MTLIDNAREVWLKAWSWRFAALATVFSLLDLLNQLLPFLSGALPDKTLTVAAAVCGAAAVLARFLKQQNMLPGADK